FPNIVQQKLAFGGKAFFNKVKKLLFMRGARKITARYALDGHYGRVYLWRRAKCSARNALYIARGAVCFDGQRENALFFASGDALRDLLLHQKDECRGLMRRAQELFKQRTSNVVGYVADDLVVGRRLKLKGIALNDLYVFPFKLLAQELDKPM